MWDHFGVTYEEGGKDLLTAGGSRDRANEIYREVWKKDPPVGLVHEFFTTSGGKKMSTSKGLGAAASELVAVYPPELIRFLMLRTHPKRHVEFDPAGLTLPKLMDEYDQGGDAFLTEPESAKAKTWALSQVAEDPAAPAFRVRFSIVADWLQIPSVDPHSEADERKGAPLNPSEREDLDRRVALARVWLERWAPDDARFRRLHASKDYLHMARLLQEFPGVKAHFTMVPSLRDQLEDYARGADDEDTRVTMRTVDGLLTPEEKEHMLRRFFSIHHGNVIHRHDEYRRLLQLGMATRHRPELLSHDYFVD